MKIAVAAMSTNVAEHFGHCEHFLIFNVENGQVSPAVALANPGHRPGFLPNYLADNGAEVIIAGGMGGGMVAFFGSTLQMGIETVLDTVGFDKLLEGADMVFSGEGKLDAQSLLGKVVIGVARRAKRAGVPLVAVVGDIGDNIEAAYDMGVSAVFSINRVAVPFREAKPRSKSDLALTMDNLMRFCRRMGW